MRPCHIFEIVGTTSTLQYFWPTPLKLSRDCNKFVINVDILLRLGLLFWLQYRVMAGRRMIIVAGYDENEKLSSCFLS